MARIKCTTVGQAQEIASKAIEATIYVDDKGFYIVEAIVKEKEV